MIRIYILLILLAIGGRVQTQTMYGTTGLLYAPTVDMQCDKTFMIGGNVLHLTPLHNFSSRGFRHKAINGLNLMAEYDSRTFNVGGTYSIWKDRINLVAELNNGKYFSDGVYFKLCLK